MVPQNGWFIRENPINMDDLGGKKNPIFGNTLVKFSQNLPSKPVFHLSARGICDAITIYALDESQGMMTSVYFQAARVWKL